MQHVCHHAKNECRRMTSKEKRAVQIEKEPKNTTGSSRKTKEKQRILQKKICSPKGQNFTTEMAELVC